MRSAITGMYVCCLSFSFSKWHCISAIKCSIREEKLSSVNKRIIPANFQVLSCMCDAIFFQQRGVGKVQSRKWNCAIALNSNSFAISLGCEKNGEWDFLSVFTLFTLKQYFQALGSTREIVHSIAMTRVEGKRILMLNFKVLWRIYLGSKARTLRGFIDFSFRKW